MRDRVAIAANRRRSDRHITINVAVLRIATVESCERTDPQYHLPNYIFVYDSPYDLIYDGLLSSVRVTVP